MALLQEKDKSDPSDTEWSRDTYSDASRSPSPLFNTLPIFYHPSIKRKTSVSLDKQKESRKGTKRSKLAPVIPSKVASIILKLPVNTSGRYGGLGGRCKGTYFRLVGGDVMPNNRAFNKGFKRP